MTYPFITYAIMGIGVLAGPDGVTPMTEAEARAYVKANGGALVRIMPYVELKSP